MADIRQNPIVKDDFNRAAEDPLSNGGKWARPDLSRPSLIGTGRYSEQCAGHRSGDNGFAYWTPDPALDGDDAECWAYPIFDPSAGNAVGVGLFSSVGGTNAADGYLFNLERSAIRQYYKMWKATNFGFTAIGDGEPLAIGGMKNTIILIRRNGSLVEAWADATGVGNAFTLQITATDSAYTTGLYPAIYSDQSFSSITTGIDDFGAGPAGANRPQIYRWIKN